MVNDGPRLAIQGVRLVGSLARADEQRRHFIGSEDAPNMATVGFGVELFQALKLVLADYLCLSRQPPRQSLDCRQVVIAGCQPARLTTHIVANRGNRLLDRWCGQVADVLRLGMGNDSFALVPRLADVLC
ncbi:hypothetical protein [Anatilimnocola floriformis]|uniref:hypothetical protein n=1 Tax=Anatilimnocola floriformis TaxID=2948575 RepID=UPI0020C236A4|nr:hypothetical protein [Anatilimnocola floriformis]